MQPFEGGQESCATQKSYLVEMLGGNVAADVLRRGDGVAVALVDGLTAGVDAGTKAGASDGFGPSQTDNRLLGRQTSAFFLIEKENRCGLGSVRAWAAAIAAPASFCPE